jgi:hypothetical protein
MIVAVTVGAAVVVGVVVVVDCQHTFCTCQTNKARNASVQLLQRHFDHTHRNASHLLRIQAS